MYGFWVLNSHGILFQRYQVHTYLFGIIHKKLISNFFPHQRQCVFVHRNAIRQWRWVRFQLRIKNGNNFTVSLAGEMTTHLSRLKRFEEKLSRFYGAQVILALQYLHHMGIIYRDLKPENVCINADGYIRICDFGFSKKIDDGRTYSFCGTPDVWRNYCAFSPV